MPPIIVVDEKDQGNGVPGGLIVKIEKPYGFITPKPINITTDKTSWTYDVQIHQSDYHLANGTRTAEIPLASGYHTVSVSHIVNIEHDECSSSKQSSVGSSHHTGMSGTMATDLTSDYLILCIRRIIHHSVYHFAIHKELYQNLSLVS